MTRTRTALALALTVAVAAPAAAQLAVIDGANLAQTTVTAARALQQIEQLRQQYDQLVRTYDAIAHPTSIGGVAGAVRGLSRTIMPPATQVPDMMAGRGGEWGQAGSMLNADRLYAPAERDEWAREMERRERVTANAKAMAQAAIEDAEQEIGSLDAMRGEVEAAPDGTAGVAVGNGLSLARQRLDASRLQLEQIRLMLAADDRVTTQRGEQAWRRDVDDWMTRTRPALNGW
jgi:conjugal transfer/entry exclusion protein